MKKAKEFLTVKEVAERLRVSIVTVRKMVKDGTLEGIRVGKKMFRIKSEELEKYIDIQSEEIKE